MRIMVFTKETYFLTILFLFQLVQKMLFGTEYLVGVYRSSVMPTDLLPDSSGPAR